MVGIHDSNFLTVTTKVYLSILICVHFSWISGKITPDPNNIKKKLEQKINKTIPCWPCRKFPIQEIFQTSKKSTCAFFYDVFLSILCLAINLDENWKFVQTKSCEFLPGICFFFTLVPFERSSAYIGKWVTLHSCCIRENAQLYCSVSHIVNGHSAKRWRKIFYLTAGENVSLYFIYGSHEFIASFKLKALLF